MHGPEFIPRERKREMGIQEATETKEGDYYAKETSLSDQEEVYN